MLSHYIADAHMPLHCDKRKFSDGSDIHAKIEGEWDKLIQSTFKIDKENQIGKHLWIKKERFITPCETTAAKRHIKPNVMCHM